MCGIVGGISFSDEFFPDKADLTAASSFLKHRGPDSSGELFLDSGAKVSLGHRRLSIIDLSSSGHQPMTSASERTTIVFNGEIYNYQSLKSELEIAGCTFKTKSDTEVILNGFEFWGLEKTLSKIDGMFAFALFDKQTKSLFLVRDRFGKKPLYYYAEKNRLAFSSDIRSFKKMEGVKLSLDMHALGYFFTELSTPLENSIWNEVKKLRPGSYLQFTSAGITENKTYWNLVYSESCKLSRTEIVLETDRLLSLAVKKRLVADVHVSALLSGGIDSSLVVAKMAEHSSGRVKTYSVGFKEDQFNELPYAKKVAEKFNTDHTELIIEPESLHHVNDLVLEFGEPFADASMIPSYLMAKEIAKSEKVVLGGDGGDELFGGYHAHYFAYWFDRFKNLQALYPLAKLLSNAFPVYRIQLLTEILAQAKGPRYALLNRKMAFNQEEMRMLFNEPSCYLSMEKEHDRLWNTYSANSTNDLINLLSASLKTRLVNDYLVKVDRATMYVSLEMRSPFLDKDLAGFASSLKPDQLLKNGETKSILKSVAMKYFEKDFIYRHKKGFEIPIGVWFRNSKKEILLDTVLGARQKMIPLNYTFIEKIINDHINGIADHSHKLWSLYVFHFWANNQ